MTNIGHIHTVNTYVVVETHIYSSPLCSSQIALAITGNNIYILYHNGSIHGRLTSYYSTEILSDIIIYSPLARRGSSLKCILRTNYWESQLDALSTKLGREFGYHGWLPSSHINYAMKRWVITHRKSVCVVSDQQDFSYGFR